MPSIEAAIEARALAHGLGALLGSNPMRLYPVQAEQAPGGLKGVPYVTYQVISPTRVHTMVADTLEQPRVQFDIWASSWTVARQVRDQVRACFDRWAGVFASTTVSASVCENGGSQVEPDEPSLLKRMTMEFIMTYQLT